MWMVWCFLSNKERIGAVIWDDKWDIIAAMGSQTHHWDYTTVELHAMTSFKHIIQLWMNKYKGIIIEDDNKSVVDFMR